MYIVEIIRPAALSLLISFADEICFGRTLLSSVGRNRVLIGAEFYTHTNERRADISRCVQGGGEANRSFYSGTLIASCCNAAPRRVYYFGSYIRTAGASRCGDG